MPPMSTSPPLRMIRLSREAVARPLRARAMRSVAIFRGAFCHFGTFTTRRAVEYSAHVSHSSRSPRPTPITWAVLAASGSGSRGMSNRMSSATARRPALNASLISLRSAIASCLCRPIGVNSSKLCLSVALCRAALSESAVNESGSWRSMPSAANKGAISSIIDAAIPGLRTIPRFASSATSSGSSKGSVMASRLPRRAGNGAISDASAKRPPHTAPTGPFVHSSRHNRPPVRELQQGLET